MKYKLGDKIKCNIRIFVYKIVKHKFSCCDEFRNCEKCLANIKGRPERWMDIKERMEDKYGGNEA